MTGGARAWYDFALFFRSWLSNPLRVAAVAPSGEALARVMTQEISPEGGPVLELGPGTGAFTRALLARGVKEEDLTLVESGTEFAKILENRFPKARVLCRDASRLVRDPLFEGRPVAAVISGLPVLSMSPRKVMKILAGAFASLRAGGAFYQFTYGLQCPVPERILERMGLEAAVVGRALLNLPPAAVYRIRRKQLPATDSRHP